MRAAWILLLLSLLAPSDDEPQLTRPQVTLAEGRMLVSIRFENAFGPELIERIESGLPSGFTYEFELVRQRRRWWDSEVASSQLEVAAMYNAVAREYLVNFKLDGGLIESRISRDLADLEKMMTEVEGLDLFALSELEEGSRCRLRARVHLGSRARFSLIPTRIETDWRESQPFQIPAP